MTSTIDQLSRKTIRGRPSKQEALLLRERIQSAALREFRFLGYARSSIDGIARCAGVSRTTIYSLYAGKESLFEETIRTVIALTDVSTGVTYDDREPAVVLREALTVLNRACYSAPNITVLRLCIAEAEHFPTLFGEMYDVLASLLTGLTDYFDRLRHTGRLRIADSRRAAVLFNMMALGSLAPFFIHKAGLTEQQRNGHLDTALEIFLSGCAAEPTPGGR